MNGSEETGKRRRSNENVNEGNEEQTVDTQAESLSFDKAAEKLISFISKCILPRDERKVKKQFAETVELRRKMIEDIDKYPQLLNVYLQCPNFVRFV